MANPAVRRLCGGDAEPCHSRERRRARSCRTGGGIGRSRGWPQRITSRGLRLVVLCIREPPRGADPSGSTHAERGHVATGPRSGGSMAWRSTGCPRAVGSERSRGAAMPIGSSALGTAGCATSSIGVVSRRTDRRGRVGRSPDWVATGRLGNAAGPHFPGGPRWEPAGTSPRPSTPSAVPRPGWPSRTPPRSTVGAGPPAPPPARAGRRSGTSSPSAPRTG